MGKFTNPKSMLHLLLSWKSAAATCYVRTIAGGCSDNGSNTGGIYLRLLRYASRLYRRRRVTFPSFLSACLDHIVKIFLRFLLHSRRSVIIPMSVTASPRIIVSRISDRIGSGRLYAYATSFFTCQAHQAEDRCHPCLQ